MFSAPRISLAALYALDARTGEMLWKLNLDGNILNGPMTCAVDSRQFIAVAAEGALYAFSLEA